MKMAGAPVATVRDLSLGGTLTLIGLILSGLGRKDLAWWQAINTSISGVLDGIGGVLLAFVLFLTMAQFANQEDVDAQGPQATLLFGTSVAACFGALSSIWIAASTLSPRHVVGHRQRLNEAFILDACSGPVAMLALFNLWGAFMVSLLGQAGAQNPERLLAQASLVNVYPWAIIMLAGFTAWRLSAAANHERLGRVSTILAVLGRVPIIYRLYLAIFAALLILPLGIAITDAVLVSAGSVVVCWTCLRLRRSGAGLLALMPLKRGLQASIAPAIFLMAGFLIANAVRTLGGDTAVLSALEAMTWVSPAAGLFVAASIFSVFTGSSWATMAVFVPLAVGSGEPVSALLVGSVLSGAILGDHASPISDTTIAASSAAGIPILDHVAHQGRYVGIAAGLSLLIFSGLPLD